MGKLINSSFEDVFWRAFRTFRHQRIFCPEKKVVQMLMEPTDPWSGETVEELTSKWNYLGPYISPEDADGICCGFLHPVHKVPWSAIITLKRNKKVSQLGLHRNSDEENENSSAHEKTASVTRKELVSFFTAKSESCDEDLRRIGRPTITKLMVNIIESNISKGKNKQKKGRNLLALAHIHRDKYFSSLVGANFQTMVRQKNNKQKRCIKSNIKNKTHEMKRQKKSRKSFNSPKKDKEHVLKSDNQLLPGITEATSVTASIDRTASQENHYTKHGIFPCEENFDVDEQSPSELRNDFIFTNQTPILAKVQKCNSNEYKYNRQCFDHENISQQNLHILANNDNHSMSTLNHSDGNILNASSFDEKTAQFDETVFFANDLGGNDKQYDILSNICDDPLLHRMENVCSKHHIKEWQPYEDETVRTNKQKNDDSVIYFPEEDCADSCFYSKHLSNEHIHQKINEDSTSPAFFCETECKYGNTAFRGQINLVNQCIEDNSIPDNPTTFTSNQNHCDELSLWIDISRYF